MIWPISNSVRMVLVLMQVPTQSSQRMTMTEAADLAAQRAFIVRTQASAVEQSRRRLSESRANFGFQVSASGTYTRYSKAQVSGSGTGALVSATRSGLISAQVPIDISGQLRDLIRSSDATHRASQKTMLATINDAKLNSRQAFIAVLRAQASVQVAEKSIADANAQFEQSEKLYKEDSIALVDLMRYRAQLSQFKSDHIQRLNDLQMAKHAFNQALALPIETPVALADISELPPVPTNPDELIRIATSSRPEVQALQETIKAQEYTISATRAGLLPSLTLSANYQPHVGNKGFDSFANTGAASLTLNIPIFDSGITKARVALAQQDQVQTRIALEQTILGIAQDVRDALTSQASAEVRLRNALEQQKLAEEVYRLALIRQEAGQGTYVDVIDAETLLAQARHDVVNTRYDYLLSAVQLQRALGDDTSRTTNLLRGRR